MLAKIKEVLMFLTIGLFGSAVTAFCYNNSINAIKDLIIIENNGAVIVYILFGICIAGLIAVSVIETLKAKTRAKKNKEV